MWFVRWRDYIEQNCQGTCPHCEAKVMDFLGSNSRKKENFKNVLGYSLDSIKKDEITLLLECPECFKKSYFHVMPYWIVDYPWLKNIDINKVLTGEARKEEYLKACEPSKKPHTALGRRT